MAVNAPASVTRNLVKAVLTHEMVKGFDFPEAEARGVAEAYYSRFYTEGRLPTQEEMLDIACEVKARASK